MEASEDAAPAVRHQQLRNRASTFSGSSISQGEAESLPRFSNVRNRRADLRANEGGGGGGVKKDGKERARYGKEGCSGNGMVAHVDCRRGMLHRRCSCLSESVRLHATFHHNIQASRHFLKETGCSSIKN
jgi:hypothetical protein